MASFRRDFGSESGASQGCAVVEFSKFGVQKGIQANTGISWRRVFGDQFWVSWLRAFLGRSGFFEVFFEAWTLSRFPFCGAFEGLRASS